MLLLARSVQSPEKLLEPSLLFSYVKFHNHVLGGGSASLTVRTEIGLGTIYKFIGVILKRNSILTERGRSRKGVAKPEGQ